MGSTGSHGCTSSSIVAFERGHSVGAMRRIRISVVSVVLCLLNLPAASAWATTPVCDGTWKLKPVPGDAGFAFSDVAAISADDVWVVGGSNAGPISEHWNGSAWTNVRTPAGAPRSRAVLNAVDARGPDDIWAVGSRFVGRLGNSYVYVIHWNGTRWKLADLPAVHAGKASFPAREFGVAVAGEHDVWILGGNHTVLHRTASGWTRSQIADPGFGVYRLDSISADSPKDVWISGWAESNQPGGHSGELLEHWDGHSWSFQTGNFTGVAEFSGIAVQSPSNVLAVGEFWSGWKQGTTWGLVPTPEYLGGFDQYRNDVVWDSPSTAWTVGYIDDATAIYRYISYAIIDRWDDGGWAKSWISSPVSSS